MKNILVICLSILFGFSAFAAETIPGVTAEIKRQIDEAKAKGLTVGGEGSPIKADQVVVITYPNGSSELFLEAYQETNWAGFWRPVLVPYVPGSELVFPATIGNGYDDQNKWKFLRGFMNRNGMQIFFYTWFTPTGWATSYTWGEGSTYNAPGADIVRADKGIVGGVTVTPPVVTPDLKKFEITGIKMNADGSIDIFLQIGIESGNLYLFGSSDLKEWEYINVTGEVEKLSSSTDKVHDLRIHLGKNRNFGDRKFFRISN